MKTRETFLMLVLLPLFLTASCDGKTGSSGIDIDPLWSKQELLAAQKHAESMGGLVLSYKVSLRMQPPFFKGKMPLEFISISKNQGGGTMMSSMKTVLCHDFGSWRNIFIYEEGANIFHGIPDGAVAVDNEANSIIAECRVTETLTREGNQLSGFKVVEIHYGRKGQPTFTSTFEIDFFKGFKVKEIETRGKKENEFFFIWPTGFSH